MLTFTLGDMATGANLAFTVVVRPRSSGALTASASGLAGTRYNMGWALTDSGRVVEGLEPFPTDYPGNLTPSLLRRLRNFRLAS